MAAAVSQNPVGFMGGKSLQRPQPLCSNHLRRHQRVHVIGHDNIRMELIPSEATLPGSQSCHYDRGYVRHAKIRRTALGAIQDAIHRYECFAGTGQHFWRKDPIGGEGAMQAECDKQGLVNYVPMRQAS